MTRSVVRKRIWEHAGKKRTAWIVDYNDDKGVRRQKTFELKKDADAFRNHVVAEIAKGIHTPGSMTATVATAAEEHIRILEDRNRNGARVGKGYLLRERAMIKRDIIGTIGSIKLSELTHTHVNEVVSFVEKRGVKPRTVYEVTNTLKTIVDLAIRRGYTQRNVVRDVMKERGTPRYEKVRTFTKEQVTYLLKMSHERHVGSWAIARKLRLGIHLAAFCGLRWGEVFGLSIRDIDLDNQIIHIKQSLDHWGDLKLPKTQAGIRSVPLPSVVVGIIREWLDTYYLPNDRELLMVGKGAASLGIRRWHKNWINFLENIDLFADQKEGNFHFHALRHFAASLMIDSGIPITDAAAMMGHSHYDMTLKVYAHPIMEKPKQLQAVEAMTQGIVGGIDAAPLPAHQRMNAQLGRTYVRQMSPSATKRRQEQANRLKTLKR